MEINVVTNVLCNQRKRRSNKIFECVISFFLAGRSVCVDLTVGILPGGGLRGRIPGVPDPGSPVRGPHACPGRSLRLEALPWRRRRNQPIIAVVTAPLGHRSGDMSGCHRRLTPVRENTTVTGCVQESGADQEVT